MAKRLPDGSSAEEVEEDQIPSYHRLDLVGKPGAAARSGARLERASSGNPVKTAAFARGTRAGRAERCVLHALCPTELGNVNAQEAEVGRNLDGADSRRISFLTNTR